MDIGIVVAIVSVLVTLISGLLSGLASKARPFPAAGSAPASPFDAANERISDVKATLLRQERQASLNRGANNLLVLGQFVVGGLLASSFAQQSLSKEILGLLGLVVLASSTLQQQFRPLLRSRSAAERAQHLRDLLRYAEDEVAPYRRGRMDSEDLWAIRKRISAELSRIETLELEDYKTPSREVAVSNKPEQRT